MGPGPDHFPYLPMMQLHNPTQCQPNTDNAMLVTMWWWPRYNISSLPCPFWEELAQNMPCTSSLLFSFFCSVSATALGAAVSWHIPPLHPSPHCPPPRLPCFGCPSLCAWPFYHPSLLSPCQGSSVSCPWPFAHRLTLGQHRQGCRGHYQAHWEACPGLICCSWFDLQGAGHVSCNPHAYQFQKCCTLSTNILPLTMLVSLFSRLQNSYQTYYLVPAQKSLLPGCCSASGSCHGGISQVQAGDRCSYLAAHLPHDEVCVASMPCAWPTGSSHAVSLPAHPSSKSWSSSSLRLLAIQIQLFNPLQDACTVEVILSFAWLPAVKTGSTLELSPECLEISYRWDLASATWKGVLHPCQVFVLAFGTWR